MAVTLAKIISRTFDLYSWAFVLNLLFLHRSNLTSAQQAALTPIIVILELLLPLVILVFFLKKGIISDVDISQRQERPRYFLVLTVLILLGTIAGYVYGNGLFFRFQLAVLVSILVMIIITLFWKISGHTMVSSLGLFFICYFFGYKFIALYLLLLPVAWARWYLKKHSVLQLLAGTILGLAVPLLTLRFGGFL